MGMDELLGEHVRTTPGYPAAGLMFRDLAPLLASPRAFGHAIERLAARYSDARLDRIAAIDARGFIFGAALSLRLGVGLVLVRKPGKLPPEVVRHELSDTGRIVEMARDAVAPGQRVLVVDDLLATGATAAATVALIEKQGATVVECAFVVALARHQGREFLGETKVFSLLSYDGCCHGRHPKPEGARVE
jgi:adenine phosphoribosyltransferase